MRKGILRLVGAAAAVFLFAWQQLEATRLGFELEGVRRQAAVRRQENAYLRLQLERLTSPSELAALAHGRLGMAPPTPDAIVLLSPDVPAGAARRRAALVSWLVLRTSPAGP